MTTKKKRRVFIASITAVSAIVVIVAVLLGMWYGTKVMQKAIIRMICTDAPSSVPRNYEEILGATTMTTVEYAEGVSLDRIEPKGLEKDAVCVLIFHGGYYVGGGRHNQEPYARLLASRGLRVFNIDYSLAPEKIYPTQIKEANAALGYVAREFPESKGYVISGDSAGAHLAAQLCALVGSGDLQKRLSLDCEVGADRLLGFVGNCGFYQASTVADTGFFLIKDALQMLTGAGNYKEYGRIAELDLLSYASVFPDSLLICGDKDPFLSENQRFRDALTKEGVRVDTYFPVSGKTELGHEFQCNYNAEESYIAADQIVEFIFALE